MDGQRSVNQKRLLATTNLYNILITADREKPRPREHSIFFRLITMALDLDGLTLISAATELHHNKVPKPDSLPPWLCLEILSMKNTALLRSNTHCKQAWLFAENADTTAALVIQELNSIQSDTGTATFLLHRIWKSPKTKHLHFRLKEWIWKTPGEYFSKPL